jgi:hypothetical protein
VLNRWTLERSLDKGDTEQAGCDVAGEHDAKRCRVAHGDQGDGMIQANSIRQIRDPSEGCSLVLVGCSPVTCKPLRPAVCTWQLQPVGCAVGADLLPMQLSRCWADGAGKISPLFSYSIAYLLVSCNSQGRHWVSSPIGTSWQNVAFSHFFPRFPVFRWLPGSPAAGGRVADRRNA